VILVLVVHNDDTCYTRHARQCHWYADTIFGTLEKWAAIRKNGTVVPDEKEKVKQGRRRSSTGSRGVVLGHRHKGERGRSEGIRRSKRETLSGIETFAEIGMGEIATRVAAAKEPRTANIKRTP
jgi:hypothetical protein